MNIPSDKVQIWLICKILPDLIGHQFTYSNGGKLYDEREVNLENLDQDHRAVDILINVHLADKQIISHVHEYSPTG